MHGCHYQNHIERTVIDVRLIDTEKVIKAVDKHTFETKDGLCLDDDISIILEDVPTIEERKTGRWIKMSDRDGIYWACSECGEDIPRIAKFNPKFDLFPRMESINKTKYCPSCGARMEDTK